MRTKAGKTITTWFFPMHPDYLDCFTAWVTYLRDDRMFGGEDALFPKPERCLMDGKFVFDTLSREIYANSSQVNAVFRKAFEQVLMHPHHPQSAQNLGAGTE